MKIVHPEALVGRYVNLREIMIEDAEFVLRLRCNSNKASFISPTDDNIEKQINYINNYFLVKNELYWGTDRFFRKKCITAFEVGPEKPKNLRKLVTKMGKII